MQRVIIIGGGIGGLCTALMLQKDGYTVQLYESASAIYPAGAGLGVGSNALKALYAAGIGKEIEAKGNRLDQMIFQNTHGERLNQLHLALLKQQSGLNNLTIHRADLHYILYEAIAPGTIYLNKKCIDFKQDNKEITAFFADGSSVVGDIIIAADGIHSVVRNKLAPKSNPRYAGYTCWRGVVKTDDKRFTGRTAYELWGRGKRIGIVPLQKDSVYWFACVNAKQNGHKYKNLTSAQVAEIYKDFSADIIQLISSTYQDTLLHHDIMDIKPLDRFVYDRVVLLGDAAHATTPNMGQGAGQALEDAIVLSRCLQQASSYKEAFIHYEQKRVKRTRKIINMSRQIGFGAQMQNKLGILIRNKLFRLVPSNFLLRRFRYLLDVDLT